MKWKGETGDAYDYSKTVVSQKMAGLNKVEIAIKGKNDAHIAFAEGASHDAKKYEVVMGGWANKKGAIRYAN